MYFFYIIICMTTFISTMTAAPFTDDERDSKKPDIDNFISRLLKSEKFEQLADKIAARAVDKIISAQLLPQHVRRAKNDVTEKPPSTTITTNKTKGKNNKDNADEDTRENEDDKNASNESKSDLDVQEDLSEKAKIDTIAAIKKISKFPVVDLSLSFKHFTKRDKLKSIIPRTTETEKNTEHESKNSYRKKANQTKSENYDTILRLRRPEIESDSESESGQTTENKSSDESTSDEHDRKSSATEEKEFLNKNIKREKQENKKKSSESSDSQNDKTVLVSKEILKTSLNKNDNRLETNKSAVNNVGTPISSSVTERLISTVAFGYAQSENSEESDDNKVSNIVDPAKVDNKMLRSLRSDMQKDEDVDNQKINDSNKKTSGDKKIETKHKIRENNGKLYAFAQSPDYEEYHEQVGNLLKAVKKMDKKQSTVNQDLLDLMN